MRSASAMSRRAPPLLVAAWLLLPSTALGQQTNGQTRLDTWQPSTPFSPFVRAEGPRGSWDGGIEFGFRLSMEYLLQPVRAITSGGRLVADAEGGPQDGVETYPVEHALLSHVGFAISPLDWLSIDLNMPFALYEEGQTNDAVPSQRAESGSAGWGDSRIGISALVLNSETIDVGLGTRVWIPFGSPAAYLEGSSRYARWEVGLNIAGEEDVVTYACGLGIHPLFFGGRDGDHMSATCAAHFAVVPEFSLGLEPHFAFYTHTPTPDGEQPQEDTQFPGLENNSYTWQLEPLGAARLHIGSFALGLVGGPGLGDTPGVGAARIMLTATYAAVQEPVVVEAPPPDADVDGIPDEFDKCPEEAGTEANNGCPDELDTDGDGLVEDDACPDQPGARSDDPKANGCPDVDNDRVADPIDDCPLEPGGQENGCPRYAHIKGLDGSSDLEVTIQPPIKFDRRSSQLSAEAVAAIKELVATMRANPKLKQISFQIGAKRTSQDLTDKRAGAILTILAQDQDFDSNRYEVVLSDDLAGGEVLVRVVK